MAIIRWSEELSVGVAEIDQQHQKLISMINDLNDAMINGKGKEALRDVINGLITYTATHFKIEERYFDQFGYEESSLHKNEHADFVKKVSDFRDGYVSEKLGLSINVMKFLSDWLTCHIKGSDKKYTACFNSNGMR
jgi:hemerythrin